MNPVHELLRDGRLWRGDQHGFHRPADATRGIASGHAPLDRALPFAGWPRGALIEILHLHPGQGELRLLLPALARLSHDDKYLVFVDPPWLPYAPALAAAGVDLTHCISIDDLNDHNRHWALEQALRNDRCGAALAWPQKPLDDKTLRRLQLAAEAGGSQAFLFRHPRVRAQHSPAALRLQLHTSNDGLQVEIIKCRGRNPSAAHIPIPLP